MDPDAPSPPSMPWSSSIRGPGPGVESQNEFQNGKAPLRWPHKRRFQPEPEAKSPPLTSSCDSRSESASDFEDERKHLKIRREQVEQVEPRSSEVSKGSSEQRPDGASFEPEQVLNGAETAEAEEKGSEKGSDADTPHPSGPPPVANRPTLEEIIDLQVRAVVMQSCSSRVVCCLRSVY